MAETTINLVQSPSFQGLLKKEMSGKTFKQLNEHILSKTGLKRKESVDYRFREDSTDSLQSKGNQNLRESKGPLSKRKVTDRMTESSNK